MTTVKKLTRHELIQIVDNIFFPKSRDQSENEIDAQLFAFCLNCPDPGAAMDLIVEAPRGSSASEVVDQALVMPERSIETWSAEELSMDHPLRHWRLESQ